jgi:uncharacterized membrane protein
MMIDDLELARAIHVLALVHWIGGLAVVTTIVWRFFVEGLTAAFEAGGL